MIEISVLNGPNLDLLGTREPGVYGESSEADLREMLLKHGEKLNCSVRYEQHSSQGGLVRAVNRSGNGLVINPGAFSHTSVAVLDAMLAFSGPVVEVHLSNIHKREPFRHRMLTAAGADALIAGAGFQGYLKAMEIVTELLRR